MSQLEQLYSGLRDILAHVYFLWANLSSSTLVSGTSWLMFLFYGPT